MSKKNSAEVEGGVGVALGGQPFRAQPAPQIQTAQQPVSGADGLPMACQGKNCGAIEGHEHSHECIVEAAESQGWMDSPECKEARRALAGRKPKGLHMRYPDFFTFVINGEHRGISEAEPPDDSYDVGTLIPLYRVSQPAQPQPSGSGADGLHAEIMEKVQEFASTWAIVDSRFDDGTAINRAEACKTRIGYMLRDALATQPKPSGNTDTEHDALRCAVGNCTFNGEVAQHAPGCPNAPAAQPQPSGSGADGFPEGYVVQGKQSYLFVKTANRPRFTHINGHDPVVCVTPVFSAQPQPSGNAGELSHDLLGRVSDALGRFVSDEGWSQIDMDLSDEFAAALAVQSSGRTDPMEMLRNPLSPWGMLMRALRCVSGTTLMDMSKRTRKTPAELSNFEFGRASPDGCVIEQVKDFFYEHGAPVGRDLLVKAAHTTGRER